jgi:hypothetical protein
MLHAADLVWKREDGRRKTNGKGDYTINARMKYSRSLTLPSNMSITIPRLIIPYTKMPLLSPAHDAVIQVQRTKLI